MVIQIKFKKKDEKMGEVKGLLRIEGKLLYYQFSNSDMAQTMLAKMQSGGAIITTGRKWMRVNIFGEHEEVKLGGRTFNPKETPEDQIEKILTEYFQVQYARAGFELTTEKLK